MPLLRPGIDVAVHTELRILSTAAWWDFKQHIILVQARGDRVATLRLWQSVGMVLHLPPGDGESAFEVPGLPPILLLPCTEDQRCRAVLGVSDSRGLAPGRGGVSWLEMVRALQSFGPDTINTMMPSSQPLGARGHGPARGTPTRRSPPGCDVDLEMFLVAWRRWQVGSGVWLDPGNAHKGPPLWQI